MKSMNRKEGKKIAVIAAVMVGIMMVAFMPVASAAVTYFDVDPDTGYAGTVDTYNMMVATTGVKTLNITIPAGFLAVEPATSGDEILTVDFWNTTGAKGFYGIGIVTAAGTGKVDVYVRFRIGGEEVTGTIPQNVDYTPGVTNTFESPLKGHPYYDTSTVKVKLPTEIDDGYMNITITCLDFYLESMGINLKQCVRNPTVADEYTFYANGEEAKVQIKETSGYGGGVYRNGMWILRTENSPLAMVYRFIWGNPTDVPFPGDWNGNGEDGIGLYRDVGTNGQWILRNDKSAGTADYRFIWGLSTDVPVAGDWTSYGEDGIGVYRNGEWILRNDKSAGLADYRFDYGNPTDVPVVGDWDGDGESTIGVYRNGQWILRDSNSAGAADYRFNYGNPTDVPVPGTWA